MSNLKKLIIILVIILIIAIGLLIYIIRQNTNPISLGIEEQGRDIIYELDGSIQKVSNRNNYYIVKNCVNKFYTYYTAIYNAESQNYIIDEEAQASIEKIKTENAEAIYNMLDKEYVNFRGITKENILSKLPKINASTINITDMYVSEQRSDFTIYIVKGMIRERATGNISNFEIMVQVDSLNRTFTLFLQDYIQEKYKNLQIGTELNIQIPERIEKNSNNVYDFQAITDEVYVTDLFNQVKNELLYYPEVAYNNLNEEYRNEKFKTLDEFKKYTKNNTKKYVMMQIEKYQKTVEDNYTQYVCIDQDGNYYIFRETATMNYSLILDTYTIDLPEFVEKYNEASEEEKVMYNIQKVFDAINDGDYKYVYNKLDNTFKQNNFKTVEEFEKYIKNTLYSNSEYSQLSYEKSGSLHIYTLNITDGANANAQAVKKTFIMQLKEGTDFVMSFNVE